MISTPSEDAELKKEFNLIDFSFSSGNDWLIFEVLTRLPVKSLLRFKTVCKRWCFLIQKDRNFIDSHLLNHSRLPRLFIVNPVQMREGYFDGMTFWDNGHDNEYESYITTDLISFQDNERGDTTATNVLVVDTLREVDSTDYDIISNPVNGLICLIESCFEYAVCIYNISTRELSPWFQSSLLSEEKDCYRMRNYRNAEPSYQFGFDPSTNEHKLVCLWKVYSKVKQRKCMICEVLTIGRQGINGKNIWRRIEEVPDVPYSLAKDSVHVEGVIYWSSFDFHNGSWGSKHRPACILAFDVGREKFRTITVSDFILDRPRNDFEREYNPLVSNSYSTQCNDLVNLLEVSGRLAMLVRMTNCMFKMYIYEDDDYKLEKEIIGTPMGSGGSFLSNSTGRWREVSSITLPFNLGTKCGVRFCKFIGSDDEIILTSSEGRNCDKDVGKKKCVSFYSYNWKKGRWREFEVRGNPVSFPHLCTDCFIATFSESLLPVNSDKALF